MIDGTKVHQVLCITKYLGKNFTLLYIVPSVLLIYANFKPLITRNLSLHNGMKKNLKNFIWGVPIGNNPANRLTDRQL
jgi:hypothetical protein